MSNKAFTNEEYQRALEIVRSNNRASTSFLQREMQTGYNVAAEIIGKMEKQGIISAPNHMGKREVLKP